MRVRAPAREAIVQLMGRLPGKAQAAQQLYDLARSYFAGKQTMRTDVDGRVTLWTWDPATKQCTSRNCAPEDAARAVAARLARAARSLAPDNRQVQMLALAAALEQIVYDRGLDKRLDFKDPTVPRDRRARSADDRGRVGLLPGRAPSGGGPGGCRNPRQDAASRRTCCRAAASRRRWCARCEAPIGGCGWPPWKRSRPCSRRPPLPVRATCWSRWPTWPRRPAAAGHWSSVPTPRPWRSGWAC